jgi:Uma2 family endonuclease
LTAAPDDGTVVVRGGSVTIDSYFHGPESLQPRELIYGVVREPPAPLPYHQLLVTRLTVAIEEHVTGRGLGDVYVSPIDVVFDAAGGLVLQPDIIFVAAANRGIVRDRVWGAPDLVVEVLSSGTAQRDRTAKLAWYRQYGVKEYWLVDPAQGTIEVVDCTQTGPPTVSDLQAPLLSPVLGGPVAIPDDLFYR